MRSRIIASVVAAQLMLGLLVASTAVAGTGSPFAGMWVSTDTDGSSQVLIVASGDRPAVTYQDFFASTCANHGSPSTHWVSAGRGVVDGDVLWVDFHKSGCGTFSIGPYGDSWSYDPATDTLADASDVTWYRAP